MKAIMIMFLGFIVITVFIVVCYLVYEKMFYDSEDFKDTKKRIAEKMQNANRLLKQIKRLKNEYVPCDTFEHKLEPEYFAVLDKYKYEYLCRYFKIEISKESIIKFRNLSKNLIEADELEKQMERELEEIDELTDAYIPYILRTYRKSRLVMELGIDDVEITKPGLTNYVFVCMGDERRYEIPMCIKNVTELVMYLKEELDIKNTRQLSKTEESKTNGGKKL